MQRPMTIHQNLIADERVRGLDVTRNINPSDTNKLIGEYARGGNTRHAKKCDDERYKSGRNLSDTISSPNGPLPPTYPSKMPIAGHVYSSLLVFASVKSGGMPPFIFGEKIGCGGLISSLLLVLL